MTRGEAGEVVRRLSWRKPVKKYGDDHESRPLDALLKACTVSHSNSGFVMLGSATTGSHSSSCQYWNSRDVSTY
jgi:hypothetical protein